MNLGKNVNLETTSLRYSWSSKSPTELFFELGQKEGGEEGLSPSLMEGRLLSPMLFFKIAIKYSSAIVESGIYSYIKILVLMFHLHYKRSLFKN